MISRTIEPLLLRDVGKGKILLILGPRQVGKTTLLHQIATRAERVVSLNCDNADERLL